MFSVLNPYDGKAQVIRRVRKKTQKEQRVSGFIFKLSIHGILIIFSFILNILQPPTVVSVVNHLAGHASIDADVSVLIDFVSASPAL